MSIYRPPPLDDVWLKPEERRERHTVMEGQRRRNSERVKKAARAHEQKEEEMELDPVTDYSDNDIDDEGSIQDDLLPTPGSESEGDTWSNHPSEVPQEAPPPPSDVPNNQYGRGSDSRSRRLACVNGPKKMPNKVHRALREKFKYKNRTRSCRCVGDAMFESSTVEYRKEDGSMSNFDDMEVPSLKYLKEYPLTSFIHLAANDCGFAGSCEDIITNWIHPLFFKSKN